VYEYFNFSSWNIRRIKVIIIHKLSIDKVYDNN
jgi:hypothetical protein